MHALLLMLCLVLCLPCAAQAQAQAPKGKPRRIGFSQATTTEPWRILFNAELRAEAASHPDLELLVRDAMDDAVKQIADMEDLIARKVDVILISPKVSDRLLPVVNKAADAGIPVIVLDRDVPGARYTQFIGGDNRLIGRAAGDYAVSRLGGAGKARGKYVEIWGGMASSPAQDRHAGFLEIVSREPGLVSLMPALDGDWKQDRGYDIMAEALAKHPDIQLVYAHNDPMAYGAWLAAKDAGREQGILFLGIDGIPAEGVRWVQEGVLTATFLYMTPGAEGVRQALRLLAGETIPPRVTLPTLTIDAINAKDILKQAGLKP